MKYNISCFIILGQVTMLFNYLFQNNLMLDIIKLCFAGFFDPNTTDTNTFGTHHMLGFSIGP